MLLPFVSAAGVGAFPGERGIASRAEISESTLPLDEILEEKRSHPI
jgi:hypothetical protein